MRCNVPCGGKSRTMPLNKPKENIPDIPKTPRLGRWLFGVLASYDEDFCIDGDFDEEYHEIKKANGNFYAWCWYWRHIALSIPVLVWDMVYWRFIMIKNYLTVALRTLRKQKGYAFINITGLAIGLAVCSLIMLWVVDELSYDKFHEKGDRICRLILDADIGGVLQSPATMPPAGPTMTSDFPEVENFTRMGRFQDLTVEYGDKIVAESGVGYADATLFEIFSFPFISGDPETALERPNTIVITEEMAQKYFGDEDPIGKFLKIGGEDNYSVTGVIENIPLNSMFRFNMVRSLDTIISQNPTWPERWLSVEFQTFVLLTEGANRLDAEEKLPAMIDQHLGERLRALGGRVDLFMQPMHRIHLYSMQDYNVPSNGNVGHVTLFSGIAIFVLLIACINFINLSTARSANRAQEVGMRKTLGALKQTLMGQFIGESVLYSLISMFFAIILISLAIPTFNNIIGRELSLNILRQFWIYPLYLGFAVLVGLIAGSYPAFVLSAFNPVRVLKGAMKEGASNAMFRKILVVLQFSISIMLIVGTLTVYRQIQFMKNSNLGFDKEQVVVLPRMNRAMRRNFPAIKHEIGKIPGVNGVAGSSAVPGRGRTVGIFWPEGFTQDDQQTMQMYTVDDDYIPMMNMELAAGRNFSADLATDTTDALLINETAARQFGWTEPIGKKFTFAPPPGAEGETTIQRVVGVVKDFHTASMRREIIPVVLFFNPVRQGRISVRLAADEIPATMDRLREKWAELNPQGSFDYFFLDDSFDELYRAEERVGTLTLYFSTLAIFIGCLGLFGLAAFMAQKRTKEIGIRKVMGASIMSIVGNMSKEFTILVVLSNLVAWPVAYFGMQKWLEAFAYRAGVNWLIFLGAGLLALLVALLTISSQAFRAAKANPVDSLRYE